MLSWKKNFNPRKNGKERPYVHWNNRAILEELEKKVRILVPFNKGEMHLLQIEVQLLLQYSAICKLIGSYPSREEVKELFYNYLQIEAKTIWDI